MQVQDQQRARDLPAPATIAPSRDAVLSKIAFFFGDPAVPEKLRDYSEHHAMTFSRPVHYPTAARLPAHARVRHRMARA